MTTRKQSMMHGLRSTTSAVALGLTIAMAVVSVGIATNYAYADSHSGSGGDGGQGNAGQGNANAGGGNDNAGGGGHDSGDDHGDDHADGDDHGNQAKGGSDNAGGAGGAGGHDDASSSDDGDSDGRGPEYGKPDDGSAGGKPIWAQEGIPEVELGRLNVARSPDHVLEQAYDEALSTLDPAMASYYDMTLQQAIAALSLDFDNVSMIDSPLQNLALLKDALDGTSVLNTYPGVSNDVDVLAAMFLGAASDKTVTIVPETALAVSAILGFDLTASQAVALAADAEAIRIAILAGHG